MKVETPEPLCGLLVPLSKVHPCPDNPRAGHDVEAIAKSLEDHGWHAPIVARAVDGEVIIGHGRLAAAKLLGLQELPVLFVADDQAQAARRMVADNRLGELSSWDIDKLLSLNIDLLETGWSELAQQELESQLKELSIMPDFSEEMFEEKELPPEVHKQTVISIMIFASGSEEIEEAIAKCMSLRGVTRAEAFQLICHEWQEKTK